ncbi:MAG: quinone oxidoreductase [Sphingomonas bacterium]|uniref:quinone oxidoreductase family protein n=1 Tax=Sphingomonas bacterium TaxID=1895847 RepID=UPI00260C318D|nr:quinone oxidoreductase [Sphingomonas bacterium]MDB5695443.1 quinone oxidoreductase [Sphingomonas bacterium]
MEQVAVIEATGGPDVIGWRQVDLPPPGPGEVRLRHGAVGLNFIDTYHRSGLYPLALPSGLGLEAAGIVEAVGEGVDQWQAGDRAGTFSGPLGAYATARNIAVAQLVRLSDAVDDRTAAAIMLKGATAAFLVEQCARVQTGQTVLVTAAAGGVGHLLVGWLKAVGATVIGTVSTEAKALRVRAAGADHVLLSSDDVVARVREITDGQGVPVVLDGVGKATWPAALASASRRGLIVSYGNASGPVAGVDLGLLARHGSLFVTRPTLFDYAVTPSERQALADRVFAMLAQGAIRPEIGQTFALTDAAAAHRAIEAGETQGSTVLLP